MKMASWIEIAENLPQGNKARGDCPEECGSGGTLSINHDHKRLWCSCFRCGYTESQSKGIQTLAELQRIKDLNDATTKELPMELPHDYTEELPRHARAWLFAAGVTPSVYKEYRIGYSASLDRVVLPVFDDFGTLIWYQCRALLKGQKPKYIQPSRDRSEVLYKGHRGSSGNTRAVIVEDILSAIRVGKHIDTYSLLGTKITPSQATSLSSYKRVTTWLDPDTAGRRGAYKIRKALGLLTDVDNIITDVDPKELSDEDIIKCLNKENLK